jgi:DNA invertase Pin-like site-specific DNA recombinase
MKRAIIYSRVSSIGERQNTDRQISDMTAYAESNGYEVIKVYSEKISGGKKNTERVILQECLEYARANKALILVSELSRVGRQIWEVLETVKFCIDCNINMYFHKENFSLFDENGKVLPTTAIYISCLGFCAEIERENISYRLNSGRALAIERGVKMGRKKGSIKTKEQKSEEYANVIRSLRKGNSLRDTAKICNVSLSTVQRVKREFCL